MSKNNSNTDQTKQSCKAGVMVSAVQYLISELDRIGKKYNIQIKAEKGWIEERNQIIKNALQKENGNK